MRTSYKILDPRLSDKVLQALEFPIMTEEVLRPSNPCPREKPQAQMALHLPTSQKFVELLVPHFIKAYNSIAEGHGVGYDTLRAHITLIPNDGKDLTECQSYRPIIGTINMREARDSITRVLDLIHAADTRTVLILLLLTDAEQTFVCELGVHGVDIENNRVGRTNEGLDWSS